MDSQIVKATLNLMIVAAALTFWAIFIGFLVSF